MRLLFQPAEEGGAGAKVMIHEGALGAAQAIFGFHVDPGAPVGVVSSKPGPIFASSSSWEVEITAQGGHAAFPHRTGDPILTASTLILSLQQLVSRECDPLDSAVSFSSHEVSSVSSLLVITFEAHPPVNEISTVLPCFVYFVSIVSLIW